MPRKNKNAGQGEWRSSGPPQKRKAKPGPQTPKQRNQLEKTMLGQEQFDQEMMAQWLD